MGICFPHSPFANSTSWSPNIPIKEHRLQYHRNLTQLPSGRLVSVAIFYFFHKENSWMSVNGAASWLKWIMTECNLVPRIISRYRTVLSSHWFLRVFKLFYSCYFGELLLLYADYELEGKERFRYRQVYILFVFIFFDCVKEITYRFCLYLIFV